MFANFHRDLKVTQDLMDRRAWSETRDRRDPPDLLARTDLWDPPDLKDPPVHQDPPEIPSRDQLSSTVARLRLTI